MSDSQSPQSRLDLLAEEFAAQIREGKRPSISEYVADYPDLADEIRDLFPALVMMEQVDHAIQQNDLPSDETDDVPAFKQLGDFRIIREVGRGGMGIVYEAEQVSLGRRVALKVLPKQTLLDSQYKKRFVREAKAAARLHHTNIVPVFGVGEQEGVHYYVMQFIQGLGLDQVLLEVKRLREISARESAASRTGVCLGRSTSQTGRRGLRDRGRTVFVERSVYQPSLARLRFQLDPSPRFCRTARLRNHSH